MNAAEKILHRKTKSTKSQNPEIKELSKHQKILQIQINSMKDKDKRKEMSVERNLCIYKIHNLLKKEKEQNELDKIEDIEKHKNDSSRMFKAVRLMN